MDWFLFRLITAIIAGSFCLFLSAFSYLRNRSKKANQIFSVFNLFLGLWNLSDIAIAKAPTHSLVLLADRLSYAFAVPVMPLFLYLCVEMTGIRLRKRIWHRMVVIVGCFLVAISFTPYLIRDVVPSILKEIPGPLFPVFAVYMLSLGAAGLYILLRGYKEAAGIKKSQLKYAFLAFIFAFAACVNYLAVMAGFNIWPIYYLSEMAYTGIIAYAIFKYRLMDIRIFIRRAMLLLSIYFGLMLALVPTIGLIHSRLVEISPAAHSLMLIEILLASLVLSAAPFLYILFIRQNEFFHEHTMAGITHELKSPLAAIESALEILDDNLRREPAGGRNVEYVEMIQRNAERLKGYVNDLLQVFRVKDKKVLLDYSTVEAGALCGKVVEAFKPLAMKKGIELTFERNGVQPQLACDPVKIEQVLSNLVSNAIKFTDRGHIKVHLNSIDGQVQFIVQDTGQGIPPEELPYVFDRFFQGKSAQKQKGTGIGLAIAKAWVEAHGGEIHAESGGTGRGSRFSFWVPKS